MVRRVLTVAGWVFALSACARAGTMDISANSYLDKLRGIWLGEIMGNYAGRTTEGTYQRGGLNYTVDWNTVVQRPSWEGDDDTGFEYLNLTTLEAHPSPTGADIRQSWVDHIPVPAFAIANRQARWLMDAGKAPPQSGSINYNFNWSMIDSQITTEALGGAAPGMRQLAANLTGSFASATNDGYAVHAAQYYAAMYSAAAFNTDVPTIISKGLEVVPRTSRTYSIIQDVRNWYAQDLASGSPDWHHTQTQIWDKYYAGDSGRYQIWVESGINTAMTTMSLLYGGGDFQRTTEIAVQGGFDTDCNAATAGGLIGMINGFSNLPTSLTSQASDLYYITGINNVYSGTCTTISATAARWQAAAEAQILLAGGSITGTGTSRMYHIAGSDAIGPLVEKPDPTGPGGLVGALLRRGGTISVSGSGLYQNPTADRYNLGQIIDGIKDVSYNGHRSYTTQWGIPSPDGDFYQLTMSATCSFKSVLYCEGALTENINANPQMTTPIGGYFTTLTAEVCYAGQWREVSNLHFSEPLDPYKEYQQILMTFDPITGQAIRIRGQAGGTGQFTSILELEAYGALPGDADGDGTIGGSDYTAWLNSFGVSSAQWAQGDLDGDGTVGGSDYAIWLNNFGVSDAVPSPEPSSAFLLAVGLVLLRRRRSA